MKELGLYRKSEIDCFALLYYPDTKQAEAIHMTMPPIGGFTGVGKSVIFLENIENEEEAVEKLQNEVDKIFEKDFS